MFRIGTTDTEVAGAYTIRVNDAVTGVSIECVNQPEDLWKPVMTATDNTVTVIFATDVSFSANKSVKLDGTAIDNSKVTASGSSITISDVNIREGQSLVISGIKYASLFPSYVFTFTLKASA